MEGDRGGYRFAEEAPRNWGPPRGDQRSLRARREYASDQERHAGELYREIVCALDVARGAVSVRSMAVAAGVAPSSVQKLLSGSGWTRWSTVEKVADAAGVRVRLRGWPEVSLPQALRAMARHQPQGGVVGFAVSDAARVMPNTFYELGTRDPNVRTVLAFAAAFAEQADVLVEPVEGKGTAGGWNAADEARRADLLDVLVEGARSARGRQKVMFLRAEELARQLGLG